MAGKNTITRSVSPKSLFESAKAVIGSSTTFAQGDLLILNSTTHKLELAAAEADGSKFCGVARVTVVNGKIQSPYNTDVVASQAIADIPGPLYGVCAKVILKTGDALVPGGLVYLDPASGSRNVTATGTKAIGVYQGETIAAAVAGQEIEILVGCRAPSDVLLF